MVHDRADPPAAAVEDALPLDAVRAALRAGHIGVLLLAVPGDLQTARDAARRACAALCAAYGRGTLHASRSATQGHAAVALWRSGPVGVDVERVRPEIVDDALLQLALHPAERAATDAADAAAFFARWARKEAVLKALGTGLAVAPATVHAGRSGSGWVAASHPAGGPMQVCDLRAPPGVAAALAAACKAPVYLCAPSS